MQNAYYVKINVFSTGSGISELENRLTDYDVIKSSSGAGIPELENRVKDYDVVKPS